MPDSHLSWWLQTDGLPGLTHGREDLLVCVRILGLQLGTLCRQVHSAAGIYLGGHQAFFTVTKGV